MFRHIVSMKIYPECSLTLIAHLTKLSFLCHKLNPTFKPNTTCICVMYTSFNSPRFHIAVYCQKRLFWTRLILMELSHSHVRKPFRTLSLLPPSCLGTDGYSLSRYILPRIPAPLPLSGAGSCVWFKSTLRNFIHVQTLWNP